MSVKVVNNFLDAKDSTDWRRIQYRTQHMWIDSNSFVRAVIVQYTDGPQAREIKPKIVAEPKDCKIPQDVMESVEEYKKKSLSEIKATIKKYGKIRD